MTITWRILVAAFVICAAQPALANNVLPAPPTNELRDIVADKGGRLTATLSDVVVDKFNNCQWLDNGSTDSEYFVPFATQPEWDAFVDNAPSIITRTPCCMPTDVNVTTADGLRSTTFSLPYGRQDTADVRGTRSLTNIFSYVRDDGATVNETVTQNVSCSGGMWTLGAPNSALEVIEEPEDPVDPGDPASCGTPVVATWDGQWRRAWGGNGPATGVGISSVTHQYMDGNSDRTVAIFALVTPAKDTNVKITAVYDNYGGFSNGSPKVAEFHIADGQTVVGGAGNIFYTAGRKGDQFRMTNNAVYMPSYDSSPNLRSVRIEYTNPCPADVVVFGSNCRNSEVGGRSCISNGTNCLSGPSASPGVVLPMNAATQAGSFCSSIAEGDSSRDGARIDFSLANALSGYSGAALVQAPMNMYVGVRTQAQADEVLLAPDLNAIRDATHRMDMHGCNGGCGNASQIAPTGAMRLFIPDVNQNARMNFERTFGIFNNGSENMVVCSIGEMVYTAASRTLSVTNAKGCRWKKNQIGVYGSGAWNQQDRFGYLNGKVWSQVRVTRLDSMPPAQCGPQPSTCTMGSARDYKMTHSGGFITGKRKVTWTCNAANSVPCSTEWRILDYPHGW